MNAEDFKIFKNIPTIKTERLILRAIEKRDLYDIYEYSRDPEVSKYLLWSPHESIRITKNYVNRVVKLYKNAQFYDWAIEYQGKMIGTCGFSKIDVLNDTAEAGYVLAREFWGRGIAPEALSAVIDFGFNTLDLRQIECVCLAENKRSLSVMRKCGMRVEGPFPNSIMHDGIMKASFRAYSTNENHQ